jgi:hypothetical protein
MNEKTSYDIRELAGTLDRLEALAEERGERQDEQMRELSSIASHVRILAWIITIWAIANLLPGAVALMFVFDQ